jgi:hypothetical protein
VYAHCYTHAIAVQSGWFDVPITNFGSWNVSFVVPLDRWVCAHPLAVIKEAMVDTDRRETFWRLNFQLQKEHSRQKDTNNKYLFIARSVIDENSFGLFFDRTFVSGDVVGYLRGKEVWKQRTATRAKPTKMEIEASGFKVDPTLHVFIRNQTYHWTIHELPITGTDKPHRLYMGLSFIRHTRNAKSINVVIEDDGLVVTTTKQYRIKELQGTMPFVKWNGDVNPGDSEDDKVEKSKRRGKRKSIE